MVVSEVIIGCHVPLEETATKFIVLITYFWLFFRLLKKNGQTKCFFGTKIKNQRMRERTLQEQRL
jgi:hypothetical protein